MKYYAIRFYKKSGKVDMCLEHDIGTAMLKTWALTNTKAKSKDTVVFDSEGNVHGYYEGTGDFPKVYKTEGEHIDQYCPGLLEAVNAENGISE